MFHRFVALGALLVPLAATAATTIVPGTICTSESTVDMPTNGALLNAAGGSSSTIKFHCPVIRSQSVSTYASTMSVTINAKVNWSYEAFYCVLRSVSANGTLMDSAAVYLPPKTTSNNGYASSTFSITLLPLFASSVGLRCNVPGVYSGETAGIVSLQVND